MNCKKCNIQTDGDIFCSHCSYEILYLYLIERVPANQIEKIFNLLPNTVLYWYSYCKDKNNYLDNFIKSQNIDDKSKLNKQIVYRRFLAFIIDILACEIVVLFIAFFLADKIF